MKTLNDILAEGRKPNEQDINELSMHNAVVRHCLMRMQTNGNSFSEALIEMVFLLSESNEHAYTRLLQSFQGGYYKSNGS